MRVRTEAARVIGVVLLRQYELSNSVAKFENGEILEGLSRTLVEAARGRADNVDSSKVAKRTTKKGGEEEEVESANESEETIRANAGRAAMIAMRQFVAHPSCPPEARPALYDRGIEARVLARTFPDVCAECAEDLLRDLGYENYKMRFSTTTE